MKAPRLAVVAVGALAILAGACGSGQAPVSSSASAALTRQVSAIRASALRHDPETAAAELAQLDAMVTSLQQQGQITPARASEILVSASEVNAQLAAITTTTTSTTTSTTVAPTTTAPPKNDHGSGPSKPGNQGPGAPGPKSDG